MKLKYYLRGIGIGIIVTFLILYFTRDNSSSMSDADIIKRAKELGMIENVTLSNVTDNNSSSVNALSTSNNQVVKNNNSDNYMTTVSSVSAANSNVSDVADKSKTEINNNPSVSSNLEQDINQNNNQNINSDKEKEEDKKEDKKDETAKNDDNDSLKKEPEDNKNTDENNNQNSGAEVEKISITIIAGDSSYSAAKKLQKAGLVESAAKFDEYLCRNGFDKYIVTGTHQIPVNATEKEMAEIITSR